MTHNSNLVTTTLLYYRVHAKEFVDSTVYVDMKELYNPFLDLMPRTGTILDAGCGSGRDTLFFTKQGYKVIAFDNSPEIVSIASDLTGQNILLLSFDDLAYRNEFDGVWACSSILHVPQKAMPKILSILRDSLKLGGILYTSYKYGEGEVLRGDRLFCDYTEASFSQILQNVPDLEEIKYWKTQDLRPGREGEFWLNILLRKI